MNYILFDGPFRNNLLPFTFTRPVADIRVGILTIREKWEHYLKVNTSTLTESYLSHKFKTIIADSNVFINASYLPTNDLCERIRALGSNEKLVNGDIVIAYKSNVSDIDIDVAVFNSIDFQGDTTQIRNVWDIFSKNGEAIIADFKILTRNRKTQVLSKTVNVINPENIFVESGATLEFVTLNASTGPIFIGKDSEVMEGSIIRGPFSLGEKATVKMGAKIYGPTTIGPYCKVGGEINNSVLFANSNKGHDGYLGNSVLGEWCNLGADTNNSNLKNNYSEVRLWSYESESFAKTGLQFCGLMMGDHSKCAINTMFNTGTVVGVNANIFGSGFPRNFIPSFTWGGNSGLITYKTNKAYEVASLVMARRNVVFADEDRAIMDHVFEITSKYRRD